MYALCAVVALLLTGDGRRKPPPPAHFTREDIFLPHGRALIIQEHLRQIVARGWGVIGPGELYHGHVLLSPRSENFDYFDSMDQLFSYSPAVLYHSDELLNRWKGSEGMLPVMRRTPRSIIGYWDGRIEAASDEIAEPTKTAPDFSGYGTIHEDDLAMEHPERFAAHHILDVVVPRGMCRVSLQFDIVFGVVPEPVITVENTYYTVSLPCNAP
jgi:hypothetical protein